MSLYGEFSVPTDAFALHYTLEQIQEITIETERVVATEVGLTNYFWVSGCNLDEFETVSEKDPSIQNLRRLDEFDRATLFRAEWTEQVDAIIFAYLEIGATILEATGSHDEWHFCMRFDTHDRLDQFQDHCDDQGISFRLTKLHEITQPHTGSQFGLTEKQSEALVTAWKMDYFTTANVTLADVASELGITPQSLSERLQRGYQSLIANTIVVTPPSD
ncbi:helix-turn-helix domain-containing protein [Natronorubrum aibiense]|uniref:Bacterio-opsin activator n=1 Tax=Natronorubrum aibiense TaxID=348826 RepID=A0A5P9P9F2_9EURY|nr:bacterio-opsin activator domain-containing protein [Natronorubrum aibiense]QFU84756.1 bacterio-opsin activator [Natronorubrum aibiense]